jgi:hypothetical protein
MPNAVDDSGLIPGTNKLLFWLRIQHRGMAVEFMKFEDFHHILISTNSDFRRRFQQYHSIWGGIDLMVDPRQVTASSSLNKMLTVGRSEQGSGMDSKIQPQRYLCGLQILESIMPVWPPSREVLRASRKFNVIMDLDQIATRTVNSPRPLTTILSHNNTSQSFEDFVLKREGSDCTRHVLLPDSVDPLNLPPDLGHFRWLKQSYVPALQRLGEWRMILVDCKPLYVIHTAPGRREQEWVFLHRDAGLSLAEMR